MVRYVLKRFGYMLFTLWVIITLTFVMMHAIPGDPFLNPKLTPIVRANLMAKYHLDEPLYKQYFMYFANLLQGDLGISMQSKSRTVNELIHDHFPNSAQLGMWALSYSIIGGLALGIIAALKRNKWPDYIAIFIAVVGVAVPGFVLGTLMQFLFAVQWKEWFGSSLFPVAGWDTWKHRVMPAFVLGLGTLAVYARMMRSSMLDVLGQDYIKTAKAKGLSATEVVWRHAIRNALLPIVTMLGPTVVGLITGAVLTETVFGIPGLGKYYADSVTNSDYTVILGTTVFFAGFLIFAMFLVDIAYGLVDPRIRLVKGKA